MYKEGTDKNIVNIKNNDEIRNYYNRLGLVDFGNLLPINLFEGGYVFLAVLSAPMIHYAYHMMETESPSQEAQLKQNNNFRELQNLFIRILEHDFKGLSGLDDITSDTVDISDNIAGTRSSISKTNKPLTSDISMRYIEKRGSVITKYIDRYLSYISDPYTHLKNYSGLTEAMLNTKFIGYQRETFDMLYIVTDGTCLNVEKAFLLTNAQPRTASYSEVYESEKGDIGHKEVNINWTCSVITGSKVNDAAAAWIRSCFNEGRLVLDSLDYNWSISKGDITDISKLELNTDWSIS